MSNLLFYDTETTGLPEWNKPSSDSCQPRIVQLTALLTDETGKRLSSMDIIIRPNGWEVPSEVSKIHGITTERAFDCGVSINRALPVFIDLWCKADLRIGHSEPFDARMIRIELFRYGDRPYAPLPDPDAWKEGKAFCTMRAARDIVKVPPTDKMMAGGRKAWKNPTLGEAYQHFVGREFKENAHNAMYDVMACRAVYFGIQRAGKKEAA